MAVAALRGDAPMRAISSSHLQFQRDAPPLAEDTIMRPKELMQLGGGDMTTLEA